MSVYFIRHAKVLYEFESKYDSNQYLNAVKEHDESDIEMIKGYCRTIIPR